MDPKKVTWQDGTSTIWRDIKILPLETIGVIFHIFPHEKLQELFLFEKKQNRIQVETPVKPHHHAAQGFSCYLPKSSHIWAPETQRTGVSWKQNLNELEKTTSGSLKVKGDWRYISQMLTLETGIWKKWLVRTPKSSTVRIRRFVCCVVSFLGLEPKWTYIYIPGTLANPCNKHNDPFWASSLAKTKLW